MTADVEPWRVQALEAQIHELEAAQAQLLTYAEDLNHTYQESRARLQQMTELSGLAGRLVRSRNVETCARMSVDALSIMFPDVASGMYLEEREGRLRLVASDDEAVRELLHLHEATAAATIEAAVRETPRASGSAPSDVIAIPLATRGRPFGALVAVRPGRDFNEHERRVIELLAYNTAVAIENARLYQETRRLAITDPTTHIYNVRHFRTVLSHEVQKARRFRYPMSLIMADIDYFKAFNDSYGHPKGNMALQLIARALVKSLRQTDTVARYGGEEFAAILPGCDRASLTQVAEKVRRSVAAIPIRIAPEQPPVHLTISVGGACQDHEHLDAAELLSTADRALYVAKEQGRDRAYIWP